MDSKLKAAFSAIHRDMVKSRILSKSDYWLRLQRDLDLREGGTAKRALAQARRDIAEGKTRYPGPVRSIYRKSESDGLRYVGRVIPESWRDVWDSHGNTGWYTYPYGDVFKDGSGLCFGVVYQLPGRNGESRFVAGYEFGGVDGGPSLDLSRVFTEPPGDYAASPRDLDAAKDAARAADYMARKAAEEEREYQTAWQAGSQFAALGEDIRSDRAELLSILAERRKVKGTDAPALCNVIRGTVKALLRSIHKARKQRRTLAQGDAHDLAFWPGDERLQVAFCEGAGLDTFPA